MKKIIIGGILVTAAYLLIIPAISWIECYRTTKVEDEKEWLGI